MKKYIGILICLALVFMGLAVVQPTLADYSNTLILENKNPTTWAIIAEQPPIQGTLSYNLSGTTFDFTITATGLADGNYSLIYYADKPDEFHYWGGDNPGALIWQGSSSSGTLNSGSQSVALNINLPKEPDYNIIKDYCGAPDSYATCHGAKIWLIPSSAITPGVGCWGKVTAWPPNDNWLFETGLINYQYLPSGSIELGTTVLPASIGMNVSPTSLAFGSVAQGVCSSPVKEITLQNSGSVAINVTASTSAGFYTDCLKLSTDGTTWVVANGWTYSFIPVGESKVIYTKVCIPAGYTTGTYTGTVSFVASVTP